MPAPTGRGNSLQNIQHYAITDNPVFKVKVRSLATNFEQPAGDDQNTDSRDDYTKKFKIGDKIIGKELKGDKTYVGKIIKINNKNKEIIIIDEETEKKIKLDVSSCRKFQKDEEEVKKKYQVENESKILKFDEFIKKGNC